MFIFLALFLRFLIMPVVATHNKEYLFIRSFVH